MHDLATLDRINRTAYLVSVRQSEEVCVRVLERLSERGLRGVGIARNGIFVAVDYYGETGHLGRIFFDLDSFLELW